MLWLPVWHKSAEYSTTIPHSANYLPPPFFCFPWRCCLMWHTLYRINRMERCWFWFKNKSQTKQFSHQQCEKNWLSTCEHICVLFWCILPRILKRNWLTISWILFNSLITGSYFSRLSRTFQIIAYYYKLVVILTSPFETLPSHPYSFHPLLLENRTSFVFVIITSA